MQKNTTYRFFKLFFVLRFLVFEKFPRKFRVFAHTAYAPDVRQYNIAHLIVYAKTFSPDISRGPVVRAPHKRRPSRPFAAFVCGIIILTGRTPHHSTARVRLHTLRACRQQKFPTQQHCRRNSAQKI